MPTYNYRCLKCKEEFSVFQNMSDEAISQCRSCDSGIVQKIITGGSGLIFKGSGFYLTDYKKKNKSKD
jgi:putative FmdB family regulatory protein